MTGQQEYSLLDVLKKIWSARAAILAGAVIGLFAGFLILGLSTPLYRGNMIVAPADGYGLGDYASSVSDGNSMALPFWRPKDQEGVSTDFYRFVYTLKGPAAAAILLKDESVLAGIAKDQGWLDTADGWNADELSAYLEKKVKIEHLGTTPLRKIVYYHPDPAFASAFLRKLHLVADQLIRRDRRRQSESRIAYLKNSLRQTVNPDHRKGITSLLMQQEHVQMLANLDEPYAAIVVEQPSATPRPVRPDKMLVYAVFVMIGAAAGYMFKLLRDGR